VISIDLPVGFNYYALGHYHDHIQKNFPELDNSLVAYPGSLDLGHNESISDVEKGFLLVDLSTNPENVTSQWIRIEKRRPQLSQSIDYDELDNHLDYLLNLSKSYQKKPIIELNIKGQDIPHKILYGKLSKLNDHFLYYTWNLLDKEPISGYSYDFSQDFEIDKELSKLISECLKSESLTNLSLDLIQMINSEEHQDNTNANKNKIKQIANFVLQYYENNKKNYQKKNIGNLI
jgi:DNA repair protein SbcD/Mre11